MEEQQTTSTSGFKFDKKTIISIIGLLLLISAIPIGVYLSQQKQIFKPKAAGTPVSGPEASLSLVAPSGVEPGKEIRVGIMVRSDLDAANLVVSKLKFPADLLEVTSIDVTTGPSFVKNWIEKTFDNTTGTISISGGLPSPGFKTTIGQHPEWMAQVIFKTKKAGSATVSFDTDSAIYRNSDNVNVLAIKRDANFKIETPVIPTPTTGVTGVFGKAISFSNPDGKGTNRIEVFDQDVKGLDQLNTITAEAWIKPTIDADGAILMKLKGSGNNPGDFQYYISLLKGKSVLFCVRINSAARTNCGAGAPDLGASYQNSGWYHVAMVFDRGVLKTFVNGKLAVTSGAAGGSLLDNSATGTLYIGGTPDHISSVGPAYKGFNGDIDEIRFSNNARYTADFIPSSKPFELDANTLALWHYDGNFADSLNKKIGQIIGKVDFVDSTIGVTPTPTPTSGTSSRVFVTSTTYNGNLGGLAGADAKCQARADAAGLGGVWKAWLSDSKTSAVDRLVHSTATYKRLDGRVIAANWNDLTDGLLSEAITVTELTAKKLTSVWTGTQKDGTAPFSSNLLCSDWQSGSLVSSALTGASGQIDNRWTGNTASGCSVEMSLYCFEQGPTSITPTPTGIKGDVNGDGKITLVDMSALLSKWGKQGSEAGKADLNSDGVVNTFDYSLLLQILIQNKIIKGSAELPTGSQR